MGSIVSARVEVVITLESALHIGTGLGMAQLLDDRIVQGPHADGTAFPVPYLPGASLKGRLRHHARQLSHALGWSTKDRSEAEAALFGFADRPGGLVYTDLHLDRQSAAELLRSDGAALLPLIGRGERSFVSLSRGRRVALSGRLFRLELAEKGLVFAGAIDGYLPAATRERDLGLLLAALRELTHLGGHKGRGLGKCQVEIAAVSLDGALREWAELVRGLPCKP